MPAAGQAECLWVATGRIHIVFIDIYIFIYFSPLMDRHPDQAEKGTGQGCWCCMCSREC